MNKKQLLSTIQVLCSHNIVTLKDIRYSNQKNNYRHFDYVVYWGSIPLDPNSHFLKTGGPIKNQSYMPEKLLTKQGIYMGVSIFFI